MRLLELLPLLEKYGRIKRTLWNDRFLIRPIDNHHVMILCDLQSMIMKECYLTFEDLVSNDWELLD